MTESSHLIGGLLGHVYKHDPLKCVNMPMSSKLGKLGGPAKKNFGRPKVSGTIELGVFILGYTYHQVHTVF